MITKSEEEDLMNEAIGKRIDDYLTKPVNPSQIFMACKKILDGRQIRQNQAGPAYVSKANQIREWLSGSDPSWQTWIDIHRLLCEWDIENSQLGDQGLHQMIEDQKRECNHEFGRFMQRQYPRLDPGGAGLSPSFRRCGIGECRAPPRTGTAGVLHRRRLPEARPTG